jgi:hypothetical protein
VKARTALARIGLLVVSAGLAAPLDAHRLDEYLQAARVSIEAGRVSVELDLTAGVAVAPAVFGMIDTDGNGDITSREADVYAGHVVGTLVLRVDGQRLNPRLDRRQTPDWREFREGTGAIRLSASAALPALAEGAHQLFFANTHRSDIGVYLANALVPVDRRIEIAGQRRDVAQHELTIEYSLKRAAGALTTAWWRAPAGLVIVLILGVIVLRKGRATQPHSWPARGARKGAQS